MTFNVICLTEIPYDNLSETEFTVKNNRIISNILLTISLIIKALTIIQNKNKQTFSMYFILIIYQMIEGQMHEHCKLQVKCTPCY